MRYRRWGPIVLALVAACAAGCGGGSSGASGGSTPSSSPTVSASPTPSPTGPNGIASLPATEALGKVSAAAAAQTSVHIIGSVAQGRRTLALDVHAGTTAGYGRLVIGGGQVELRLTGGTIYLNGDAKALMGLGFPKSAATSSAGKWLGANASATSLSALLSFDDLVKSIVTPNGTVVAGRTTTLHGIRVYTLIDQAKGGGTLYVTTVGDPLPVQIVNSRPHERLGFADWGAPISVAVPANVVPVPTAVSSAAP